MRKSRKPRNPVPGKLPEHILASLDNPQFVGLGNSREPRDNIWAGYDGTFAMKRGLSLNRDPEDALRQIVEAIVRSRKDVPLGKSAAKRTDIGVATILGVERKRGPKAGWAKVDPLDVARRAAFLVHERFNAPVRGNYYWKPCLWDALNDKERRILGEDCNSEQFANFYDAIMKWLSRDDRENHLLFEVSVHDRETGEATQVEWYFRQDIIDRVIADLRTLGVILPDPPCAPTG